jgi:hypothetical protein
MNDHRTVEWAIDIIGMCQPIRCHQGGMWFGRNQNFADATFVDYGAADAFAVAAKALPELVKALQFIADGYDNQDVNHVDFRVKAYQVATEALRGLVGSPGHE